MSDTPLETLHQAIQAFSNSLCSQDSDAGMVRQAVVVWDEVSLEADGDASEASFYAATGDGATAIGTLGLLTYGKARVIADLGLNRDES